MSETLISPVRPSSIDLQQRILKIYDHLYANAPVRTPQGIAEEVGKILHTAMHVESGGSDLFAEPVAAYRFERSVARRLLKASDSFSSEVARTVRRQYKEMVRAWGIYERASQINLTDGDIAYTCFHLNGVLVSDKSRDVFGDALEIFRGQWAKRESGQFFTDPLVTQLAINLLQFDPLGGDDLVDICAGTGGFLLAALNHVYFLLGNGNGKGLKERRLVDYAIEKLRGQEVDPRVFEIANATLSSRISKQHKPLVTLGDSLRPGAFIEHPWIKEGAHLCAATNPPFGTKITIKDPSVLKSFELANGASGIAARAPDILFIEKNIRLLKPGAGRLAIVTPYQILSGPQSYYVREWILRNAVILCVVDLPGDTFQPHTGTKTSLLVVRRREKALLSVQDAAGDGPVFMSVPRWIGHDRRGNPIYKLTGEGKPSDELLTDIPDVIREFGRYHEGAKVPEDHQETFSLRMEQILADPLLRLNAQFHRPSEVYRISTTRSNRKGHVGRTEFREEMLGDLCDRIFYPTRFKRNYVDQYDGAIPFLGGTNISQLLLNTDKWLRHDMEHLEDLVVRPGWILVTRSGSTGIVATVPEAWNGYAMSEHIIRLVPNPEKVDPYYLYIALRSAYLQEMIKRGVFGSVIDEISPQYLADLKIPIPVDQSRAKPIIDLVRKAEESRNAAMAGLMEAQERINSLFSMGPS